MAFHYRRSDILGGDISLAVLKYNSLFMRPSVIAAVHTVSPKLFVTAGIPKFLSITGGSNERTGG